MAKDIEIYTYKMTHDYGINPCAITDNNTITDNLLTFGDCKEKIRNSIKKFYKDKIKDDKADVYIMGVSGKSHDNNIIDKYKNKKLIAEKNKIIFIAKITTVTTMGEYLNDEISNGRKDASYYKENIKNLRMEANFLYSNNFCYYGENAQELPDKFNYFFSNRNYIRASRHKKEGYKALKEFVENHLNGKNIANLPFVKDFNSSMCIGSSCLYKKKHC